MANQDMPFDQDQQDAAVQDDLRYTVEEMSDGEAFEDDWDEEAGFDEQEEQDEQADAGTYEVVDRSEVEDGDADFDDFDDFDDEEEQAEVSDDEGEVYDVPEEPEVYDVPTEPEVYDVPDAEDDFDQDVQEEDAPDVSQEEEPEVYDVAEAPVVEEQEQADIDIPLAPIAHESEVFEVPEAPVVETEESIEEPQVYDVPQAPIEQEKYDVPEAEQEVDADEIDIAPPQEEDVDVDIPQQPEQEAPLAAQPQAEQPVGDTAQQIDLSDEVDIDVAPAQDAADQSVAESATGEQEEDAQAIEVPEEPQKSAEEIAAEEEALEDYRNMMGDANGEMADVSEFLDYRRKTKTDPVASKPKKSEFDLFANRYKVKSMNATVAATDPIIYFYNACMRQDGSILMFNVYQVLQDRFVGKMIPQLFTAVAEGSSKIDELNEANLLAQKAICEQYPEYEFIISMSPHSFTKPAVLDRLLALLPEGGIPNLVFAYDCSALQSIAGAAKKGISTIRAHGIKVLLDNTERVTMDVLSEMEYDYMRIDARYYEMDNPRAEGYLRLVLNFAKEQGITTIACFCDTEDMADYMLFMGADAVQGNSVSRPMRTVPNSIKAITLLPSMIDVIEASKEKY